MLKEIIEMTAKLLAVAIIGGCFLWVAKLMGYQIPLDRPIGEQTVTTLFIVCYLAVLLGKQ